MPSKRVQPDPEVVIPDAALDLPTGEDAPAPSVPAPEAMSYPAHRCACDACRAAWAAAQSAE